MFFMAGCQELLIGTSSTYVKTDAHATPNILLLNLFYCFVVSSYVYIYLPNIFNLVWGSLSTQRPKLYVIKIVSFFHCCFYCFS